MKILSFGLLSVAATLVPVVAHAQAGSVSCWRFTGAVGDHPIGADLAISDGDHLTISAARYYYASKGIDIPLKAGVANGTVSLREPGGGVFMLRFVRHDADGKPLTFANTILLTGTWTANGRTLPATLELSGSGACPGRPRYADLGVTDDRAFESMVGRFVHGVIAGDVAETASAIHFPLRVNRRGASFVVRDVAALRAKWGVIFTRAYVARMRGLMPHDLFVRDGQAMIGDGEAWFDKTGAVAINPVVPSAAR